MKTAPISRQRMPLQRPVRRTARDRRQSSLRRGIATIWVILSLPVALILLITVVEIGNLWTARTELQTNLEAAALAGVKTWGDESEALSMAMNPHPTPGAIAVTGAARDAAISTFAVNSVNGQFFSLSRNETDDSDDQTGYDNTSCTGDIILGGFPTAGGNAFNATSAVGCGRSTMTTTNINLVLDIEINTRPGSQDTSNVEDAFRISWTSSDPMAAGYSLTQVVIDLQHNAMTIDNGLFQPGAAYVNGTTLTTASPGTFGIVTSPAAARDAADAAGNGPALHNPGGAGATDSDVTQATFTFSDSQTIGTLTGFSTLTIDVPLGQWTNGEQLVFGVDTDLVDGDTSPEEEDEDKGGDFGEAGAASGNDPADRIAFSIAFNGGSATLLDFVLQPTGNAARIVGKNLTFSTTITIIVPDEDFSVLCQKTIQVNSIVDSIFGTSLTTFPVSGRAIATARCAGGNSEVVNNPLVVHVSGVTCP